MGVNEQVGLDSTGGARKPASKIPVHVAELRTRLGQQRTEPIDVVLPTAVVVQSRTTPDPVVGDLLIESIERGVSVTGTVQFVWEADCRRCLEIVKRSQEIEIDEIFQVDAPEDSELVDFDGQQIDLFPVVRDAVALSLPLAPLCGAECAGPDPDRYPAETVDSRDAGTKGLDPRWAGLDTLKLSE